MIRLQHLVLLVIVLMVVGVDRASSQSRNHRLRRKQASGRYNHNNPRHRQLRNQRIRSRHQLRHANQPKKNENLTKPTYKLGGGKTIRYAFVFQMKRGEKTDIYGGVATFIATGKNHMKVKDNIMPRSTADYKKWAKAPIGSAFLPGSVKVDSLGKRPVVDGKMPLFLGNPADWFFPPIPKVAGETRKQRGVVVKTALPFAVSANKKASHERGYFEWNIKSGKTNGASISMRDQRKFRTDDKAIQFQGRGSFNFNNKLGMITRRSFKGSIVQYGVKYQFSVTVFKL